MSTHKPVYHDIHSLTFEQVQAAIILHCKKMGSAAYYIADEIERAKTNPECVVIFEDENGDLRAYTKPCR